MDKKYFFFDIDGTLTDIQTGIPVPSALETNKKLQDKPGIKVTPQRSLLGSSQGRYSNKRRNLLKY